MMNHEIDLDDYQIHSDLAIDYYDETIKNNNVRIVKKKDGDITITRTCLTNNVGKDINKRDGNYTTIEFVDVTDFNNREDVKRVFSYELTNIMELNNISKESSCLIIGLGNIKSTPDSLGPLSINNVLVTNYLFKYGNVEKGFRRTFALTPGVMATTGIETSDYIKSIAKTVEADFIIVIDSLSSGSIDKLMKTIQMTDTGISPGSGVGNNRKEISKEILKIPVISIGVPTVVDAVTIVSDTITYMFKHYAYNRLNINKPKNKLIMAKNINYLDEDVNVSKNDKKNLMGIIGELSTYEIKELIYEVLTPIGYNLVVSPKEIDFNMEYLSDIIGNGINRALHEKVTKL